MAAAKNLVQTVEKKMTSRVKNFAEEKEVVKGFAWADAVEKDAEVEVENEVAAEESRKIVNVKK